MSRLLTILFLMAALLPAVASAGESDKLLDLEGAHYYDATSAQGRNVFYFTTTRDVKSVSYRLDNRGDWHDAKRRETRKDSKLFVDGFGIDGRNAKQSRFTLTIRLFSNSGAEKLTLNIRCVGRYLPPEVIDY